MGVGLGEDVCEAIEDGLGARVRGERDVVVPWVRGLTCRGIGERERASWLVVGDRVRHRSFSTFSLSGGCLLLLVRMNSVSLNALWLRL
ncbi:unnamed protein product [Dovyalis caffra]|uniref:Uncharacterized protein n=1 Tax=Dovyalis caffra TaxID=77055 RepID=A0AAV1SNW4_9ROSI|nr:unnamed protein product [Dovyalis caffra]